MRGWLFSGTNKPLELIEKEDPKAVPGHALVRWLHNRKQDGHLQPVVHHQLLGQEEAQGILGKYERKLSRWDAYPAGNAGNQDSL